MDSEENHLTSDSCDKYFSVSSIDTIREQAPKSFDDLIILKKISSKSKFPIFLAATLSTQEMYALKLYPYKNSRISSSFFNEVRFSKLAHPNIIKMIHVEAMREFLQNGHNVQVSFILMELAPYGDFLDFILNRKYILEDVLIRTYFHQLIEAVEYLHSQGIAHLDIKLDNLLLSKDFQLKLADFDLSYMISDSRLAGNGTIFYRAPELITGTCHNPFLADIFSFGIVLFVMKSQGLLPQHERNFYKGNNLYSLLQENPVKFWELYCELAGKDPEYYDDDFQSLFISMTLENSASRSTISQIKQSKWFNP